jgi:hypothetical protein
MLLHRRSSMPDGRRSFSSRKGALLVLANVLAMSGCTNTTGIFAGLDRPGELRLTTLDSDPVFTGSTKPTVKDEVVQIRPVSIIDTDEPAQSQWCQYLKEDSAAEATILRSPTLSGHVDDGGKAAVSLGLSVSSFNKANLIERAAEIKCRRYLAETGLQKLAFISPQGLTAAGYLAKSRVILGHRRELAGLRKLITSELAKGNMNAEKASSLAVLIDQLISDGNVAKSQGDRRLVDSYSAPGNADALGKDLLKAESELEDLNSRIRTADAMDLTVSAGWADQAINDGFDAQQDSFSGKVSFSIKLGAVAPRRFEHERLAKRARLNAISNQEGGALWQIEALRKAHERALDGLSQSRFKLNDALAEANRLVSVLGSVENPEFVPTLIAAKIQVVKLQAERAAVEESIQEIDKNIKRLKVG